MFCRGFCYCHIEPLALLKYPLCRLIVPEWSKIYQPVFGLQGLDYAELFVGLAPNKKYKERVVGSARQV